MSLDLAGKSSRSAANAAILKGRGNSAAEWRPVVGYEGLYEVSDQGRVRRAGRRRYLRQAPNARGYLWVKLYGGEKARNHRVHVLVAAAFIGPRPAGFTVDHLDEHKRHSWVENLEYAGRLENYMRHVRRARARAAAAIAVADAGIRARATVIAMAVAA